VTPGADTLALHGALFPSAVIKRPTGDITITGGSSANRFVQSVTLGGSAVAKSWLRYGDVANGATIAYTMGGSASTWGTRAEDVPPSFADGGTQPPAEPDLGPNLLQGKSVSGSAGCNSAEAPGKAVDGVIAGNSKWCSSTTPLQLQADLGSAQTVSAFVVKNAGLGGEGTNWNTGGFTISTSTDGTNFSTAVTVTGSRASRSYQPIPSRTARYIRLDVTAAANDGSTTARVYELEAYGQPTGDLALRKNATADSSCGGGEGPEKAVNGSWLAGSTDKWCSTSANRWLQVDLGTKQRVGSVVLRHAGAGGEYPTWDTRDFDLQTSDDGSSWTTRAQVRGNTADSTTTSIGVDARYVRVNVVTPTQDGNTAARIYELEVRA
jgi:hypothetical protein